MKVSRTLSALVASGYLIASFLSSRPEVGLRMIVFLLFPLALIWFGEELGEFTGNWGGHYIDEKSPGWLLSVLGWVLLLVPLFVILAIRFRT